MEYQEGRYLIRITNTESHDLVPGGDVCIIIREDGESAEGVSSFEGPRYIKNAIHHRYRVSKSALSARSDFFKQAFGKFRTQEALDKSPITRGHGINTAAAWLLSRLHSINNHDTQLRLEDIRSVIVLIQDWKLHLHSPSNKSLLVQWFQRWGDSHVHEIKRGNKPFDLGPSQTDFDLFLAASAFDHPRIFQFATNRIVLETTGRVTDERQLERKAMQAPIRVTQQLNAARMRMRNNLERSIYSIPAPLLGTTCACSAKGFSGFIVHLRSLNLWPSFEKVAKEKSIKDIMTTLKDNPYNPEASCPSCNIDYGTQVGAAIETCKQAFHGLCLDCCEGVKEDVRDATDSQEYRNIIDEKKEGVYGQDSFFWSRKCRVKHAEMTWYFSWHARKENRRWGV